MEGGGEGGGAFGIGGVRAADDVNVSGGAEGGDGFDGEGEAIAVGLGGGEVKVEEVDVAGVVGGVEEAEEAIGVADGAGE